MKAIPVLLAVAAAMPALAGEVADSAAADKSVHVSRTSAEIARILHRSRPHEKRDIRRQVSPSTPPTTALYSLSEASSTPSWASTSATTSTSKAPASTSPLRPYPCPPRGPQRRLLHKPVAGQRAHAGGGPRWHARRNQRLLQSGLYRRHKPQYQTQDCHPFVARYHRRPETHAHERRRRFTAADHRP